MSQVSARELTVRSGDLDIAVYISGKVDAPTLVMVHGYPDDHTVWDKVIAPLASDYRIVTYDTRGSGNTTLPASTRDFRLEYLAEDLAEVVDAVSPDKPVHLIAHDWGSIQTWESVCTRRLKGRIASFTSMSGPCLDHAAYWVRDRLKQPTPASLFALSGQLLRSWYILVFHLPVLAASLWRVAGRAWPRFLKLLEDIDSDVRPQQVRDGIRGIKLYRANFFDRLCKPRQRIAHAPVQLLVSTADPFVSPKIADDLKQWVPQLWRREIAAGHWMPLQDPNRFAEYVREFVEFIEHDQAGPLTKRFARLKVTDDNKPGVVPDQQACKS